MKGQVADGEKECWTTPLGEEVPYILVSIGPVFTVPGGMRYEMRCWAYESLNVIMRSEAMFREEINAGDEYIFTGDSRPDYYETDYGTIRYARGWKVTITKQGTVVDCSADPA